MSDINARVARAERSLAGAYRLRGEAGTAPTDAAVTRILARVRAAARDSQVAAGNARFMRRFLAAGLVAASLLLGVALSDAPAGSLIAFAADETDGSVLNPTLPF